MNSDKEREETIRSLKDKIETAIVFICIIIITICCIYMFIVQPVKETPRVKSTIEVGCEKFKSFSMPLGDTTGTVEYEERVVSVVTDNDNVTHVKVERIK